MTALDAYLGKVHCMDALDLLRGLPDGSVSLIAADPPYNGVKDEEWDNQWKTDRDYLGWLEEHLTEFRRVLKPNGSLYLFASPQMAARVEVLTGEYFNVLSQIVWRKEASRHNQADIDVLRDYFPQTERIVFAEQYGSDEKASSDAGFVDAENALKARIFGEPIREAMKETGVSTHELTGAIGAFREHNHGGAVSNWLNGFNIPTRDYYYLMRDYLNRFGSNYLTGEYEYLRREYEDLRREYEDLRREYEDLRREYEDLRRPFNVAADTPYTDVWDFATVGTYPGKHPCEKPLDMMRHIVTASSRPGDVVLDCFCGSGATLAAAMLEGRAYIGCDRDAKWSQAARNRLASGFGERRKVGSEPVETLPLFAGFK